MLVRTYGQAAMGVSLIAAIYNSTLHITLLSCIRYYIIVYPMKSKLKMSCKRVMLTSFVCWIISFVLGISIHIISYAVKNVLRSERAWFISVIANAAVVVLFPTVTIIVLHCLKLRAMKRSPTIGTNVTKKMSCVLSVILTIFIVTNLSFGFHVSVSLSGSVYAYRPVSFPYMFNFSINPIIYFISTLPIKTVYCRCCIS